ncbi:nudC domain-containing protein 1-like [Saccoglossus kowalevskii]
MKAESGPFWPEVVSGDKRGEYVVDSDEAKKIHERLSHLTSEQLSLPGESDKPAYNTQELEECDAFPEDTSALTRIDGNLHQITNKVSLGSHQWLFNVQIEPEKAPGICIRHDVDGLIWQPGKPTEDEESPWKHVSTFNALGYVQASKRERKFATCAADFSYSTLCDCSKHIYIYRQCKPKTPLRNRKTGQVVRQVAKQQVVSLDSIDEILGFQACKERLYILTAKRLYIVRMTSE